MTTPRSRILLLALGGTIACRPTRDGLVPGLGAADLLAAITPPGGVQVEVADPITRTILYPADWVTLSEIIHDRRAHYDGFVITLGTDTLAHAACALALMLQGLDCGVVLTGAMQAIGGAAGAPARRNLRDALQVAATGQGGVFVVFHGKIMDGRCASKQRSDSDDAFDSVNAAPLGTVSRSKVRWRRKLTAPAGRRRLRSALSTNVALALLAPQTDPDAIAALDRYDGIVVAGYGDGNVSDNLVAPLVELARRRLVVVASQCPHGAVHHRYAGGAALLRAGALSARALSLEMACVKLMWALGQAPTVRGARQLFRRA